MKRPLLWVALPYTGGVLAGSYLPAPPVILLETALAILVLALSLPRFRRLLLYPLVFLVGWTNLSFHTASLSPLDLRRILGDQPALVTVRGTVVETPLFRLYELDEQPAWRTQVRVEVSAWCPDKGSWHSAAGRIAVSSRGMITNVFAGQTVEVCGVADRPRIAQAEGTFDYRAYLAQQDIYYVLQATEADWRILQSPAVRPLADRFRDWARSALAQGMPMEDEALRLEWALTLGWKTALTDEVSEPFIRAATYHIFAVDGLRMAIIFGIFFALLRAVGLPRAVCGILLAPLIWFYVALTGWPASAIRAAVMLTVVLVGWVLRRPSEMLNSLLAAALVILVWQPQQLFQAGFQLSFVVVLCLILLLPPFHRWLKQWTAPDPLLPRQLQRQWPPFLAAPARYSADILATSFVAWVGSLPLVALYFHIVTPVSTPANLVAVPLCALVLICNLASLLLTAWLPALALLFNHAGWFIMECIRVCSHWFAEWPHAYWYVPAPGLFTTCLYYGLLLGIVTGWLFKPPRRRWKLAAAALALSAWCWPCWRELTVTRFTVLPANGGFVTYCDSWGSQDDLLLDCGATNAVQFITKPFLRAQGVNQLPALVLTHGDLRHIGGAELVTSLFRARHVCASPVRFRSPTYRRALDHLGAVPGLVKRVSRNDRLGAWTVLHPEPDDRFSQADDNALVLRGNFSGTSILLVSDLGRSGQNALLERGANLRADIVVTGLPTAGEALADAFLDAVRPQVIVVADSEFPASERARPSLHERLSQRNVPVFYTRSTGAVTIELRRNHWEVRAMDGTRIRGPVGSPPL